MATDIAKAYVQIIPSAEGIGNGIESVLGGEAQKAGISSGKKFSSSFGGAVGTGLKVAGGAAVTAAAGMAALGKSLVSNAKETAAYGDNVDKLSQKIGISAEAFQEWDYVFSQNGADISILEGGMKKLSSSLDDAMGGSKTAIASFEKLGLSIEDLSSMSQEDIFGTVISSLQGMPEGFERTSLASDLLGRSAMELGPLLNQTANDTEALKQQAHDLGMIMSNEAVENSAAFTDAMDNMSRAMEGAKNTIIADLLPGMTEITNGFANLVAGNEGATDQLTNGFTMLGQSLTSAIPSIMEGITSIVTAIAAVAPEMISTLGQALLEALPTIASTIGELIPQIVQTILEMLPQLATVGLQIITELANSIADSLPTLIPVAAQVLVDLIQALLDNLPMLLEAGINIITGLAEGLLEAIPVLIEAIPEILQSLIEALITGIPMLVQGAVQLISGIVEALPEIIQALVEALPEIISTIVEALPQYIPMLISAAIQLIAALAAAWPQIISALIDALPQIIDAIIAGFAGLGPALIETFANAFVALAPAFDVFGQLASDAWAKIQSAFASVGGWFSERFQAAVANIKSAFSPIASFFREKYNEIVNIFTDIGSKFMEVGSQIVNGIKEGIAGTWDSLKSFLSNICGDLIALAKKILGIESPSKEFAEQVGQWIPAGIAQGIQNGMGVLNDEVQRMTDEALVGTITTSTDAINSINYMPNTSAVVAEDSRAWNLLAEYLPQIAEGMSTTVEIKQNDQGVFNAVRNANNKLKTATGYHALA